MARIAVVGNVSRDVVDGSAPRPGGCPVFAAHAFRLLDQPGQIVTRCWQTDRPFFERALQAPGVETTILPGRQTAAFELEYDGDVRTMTVTSLGEEWTIADAAHVAPDIAWVHVAPLARTDFAPNVVAALARGRRLALDGQGLVRDAQLGALRQSPNFDRALLRHVAVLKLAEEEAAVLAGGSFGPDDAVGLGVGEILVTSGVRGVDVWLGAKVTHVAATPIAGIETTGAGDAFAVAYLAARSRGVPPVEAAERGVALVARLLERRKAES